MSSDRNLKSQRWLSQSEVFLLLGSCVFLYFHLFIPPFTPIWTGGDAVMWLYDAKRMLDGEVLYRDFVQITLPATDFLYFVLFKIFGARTWIPNFMLLVLGVSLTWVTYFVAKCLNLGRAALLPPLLFLTLVYRERLDATHHWYSVLAMMAALAVVIKRRSLARIAIVGALCGLAACFTQSLGLMALLGFATFLFWENRKASDAWQSLVKQLGLLLGSFTITILIVTSYFIWKAGIENFVSCTLVFNLLYYSSLPGGGNWEGYMTGLPGFLGLRHLPSLLGFLFIHLLLPLIYILFFLRYRRQAPEANSEPWDRFMLVNLVGVFSLLSVASAPTWARLYYVSLPALILFAWLLKSEGKAGHLVSNALSLAAAMLVLVFPVTEQLHWRGYLDLPTGRTAFLDPETYERYRWVASQTRPSDFFFGGFYPDFYFLLELRNPGPVPVVTPYEYTRPDEVRRVVDGLDKHQVRMVLWTPFLDLTSTPQGDHLGPLRAYIRTRYHVAKDFPDYEVWVRNE